MIRYNVCEVIPECRVDGELEPEELISCGVYDEEEDALKTLEWCESLGMRARLITERDEPNSYMEKLMRRCAPA